MKKLFIYTIAACAFFIKASAQDKETPPAGGQPHDFKLSEKRVTKLPNGLKTTMVHYGNVPKVTISLIVSTGSIDESAKEIGLAELTGRMIEQGSMKMDFKTLSKKVAAMGGTVFVSVGKEEINIGGSVLSEFAPEFIAAIADVIRNPAMPAKELNRLKENMKRDLAVDMTVPQSIAQEKFRKALFKNHPYGRYFSSAEMIDGFTLEKVKKFYDKNFGAKRSSIYLAGKFDDATVAAAINKAFGTWKPGPEITNIPVDYTAKGQDTAVINRKDAPQTTLMIGLPTPGPKSKDYVTMYVTNSILGGSFGSRITSNIRESKGYTYSPFSSILNRRTASVWSEVADVTSEHTIDALQEIEKEINRLRDEPPSEKELKGIQNYIAGVFVLQNSTPNGIINQLQFLDKYGLPDSYLTNFVKNVNAVTPQQVSDMVKNYLDYKKMTVVMVGDEQSIKKQIEEKMPKKAF
ncbi:MAG: insulinase family protein [Bacteroidetes bacterium]|nr:insulinase family protein [Bacteroidota bacterium]